MNSWKLIHSDFTEGLQNQWERNNFTYNQTQDWINIGLTPQDCSFAVYLRDYLKCEPEEALNFVSNIEELRTQYQEYLQSQNEESEESQLIRAITLSLGIFDFSDNPLKGLTDEEAEQYLSTKRLSLKKYFVFNLGKEIQTPPEEKETKGLPWVITLRDANDNILGTAANVRRVQPLLKEHLTQLFNDGSEKDAIAFAGKNTSQPSLAWTGDKLDQKIKSGEEVYVIFDKRKIDTNLSYVRGKCLLAGFLPYDKIVALAAEASPQVRVFQSKKNALKFLKENDLKCRAVSCREKIIGEEDYCLYHQTCLAKLEEKKSIPNIQEIDTFETWFNGNCGYVINKDNSKCPFHIWLVIYESEYGEVKEDIFPMRFWKTKNLVDAHKKAQEVKKDLQENNWQVNPFCLIHWKADEYTTFDDLTSELYVRRIEVPYEETEGVVPVPVFLPNPFPVAPPVPVMMPAKATLKIPNKSPENYLKPLDVVWVKNKKRPFDFYHVGVYLGKDKQGENWVCNFTKAEKQVAKYDKWKTFTEGCIDGEVIGYRPILPFKHWKLIIRQIAWTENIGYRENDYSLFDRNCEHFANMCVYGINYSEQIEKNKELIRNLVRARDTAIFGVPGLLLSSEPVLNNGKDSTVKLTDELKETYDELGRSQVDCQEVKELEARIVVPPKSSCKIS
jgi:hypothetical protein